jgi:hypothetical protein
LLDSLSWSEERKQEQGDSAEAFDEIWNKVNEFSKVFLSFFFF